MEATYDEVLKLNIKFPITFTFVHSDSYQSDIYPDINLFGLKKFLFQFEKVLTQIFIRLPCIFLLSQHLTNTGCK